MSPFFKTSLNQEFDYHKEIWRIELYVYDHRNLGHKLSKKSCRIKISQISIRSKLKALYILTFLAPTELRFICTSVQFKLV